MSTSGLLQSDAAVFYHPLDDYTEHTLGITWTGSAGFTAGKIGSANSAIAADAFSYTGPTETISNLDSNGLGVERLDSTHLIRFYAQLDGSWEKVAHVGTFSGGTMVWGPESIVTATNTPGTATAILGPSGFIVVSAIWASRAYAHVGTVSGNTVSFGATYDLLADGDSQVEYSDNNGRYYLDADALDTSGAVFVYTHNTNASGYARVLIASGTSIVAGSPTNFPSQGGNIQVAALDSGRFMVVHHDTVDGKAYARIGSVSGTTITWGSGYTVADPSDNYIDVIKLDTDKAIVAYQDTAGGNPGRARVLTVSGTTITSGSYAQFHTHTEELRLTRMDSDSFVATYQSQNNDPASNIGTVSGTTITFGSQAILEETTISQPDAPRQAFDADHYFYMYELNGDLFEFIGTIDYEASIESASGYPSGTTQEHITIAAWVKNPTTNAATIEVQRNFNVALDSTSVVLGTGTVTWTSGISGMMSSLNDGGDHLLVLDFDHGVSGTWTLKTSVDGASYVNRGNGSGTQMPSGFTAANAKIALDNQNQEAQWVDEAVVWMDNTEFTDAELLKLYRLAEVYGVTMNNFTVAPENRPLATIGHIESSGESNLFIKRHSASGLIDPENVVFYHPVDNATEHTLNTDWSGQGVFVPGVIGSGVSALTTHAVNWDSATGVIEPSGGNQAYFGAVSLDDTHVVVSYTSNVEGTVDIWARAGTINEDRTITWGDRVKFETGTSVRNTQLAKLTSNKFVMMALDYGGGTTRTRVGEVSGTTITLGADQSWPQWGGGLQVVRLTDDKFVVGNIHGSNFYLRIGDVSGISHTITYDQFIANTSSANAQDPKMVGLDSTRFALEYTPTGGGSGFIRIGEVSGTSISWGSDYTYRDSWLAGPTNSMMSLVRSDTVVVGWHANYDYWYRMASISGVTITLGASGYIDETGPGSVTSQQIVRLQDDILVYRYRLNDNEDFRLGKVSGTTITWGPEVHEDYLTFIAPVDDTNLIGMRNGTAIRHKLGQISFEAGLSTSDVRYPQPLELDHVCVMFWGKNPCKNTSTMHIQRGYHANFTSSGIYLGENTALWSGASVQSLISTLNDGSEHFLVASFVHQSGTDWKLHTSIDGASMVDQGIQSSGTHALLASGSDAEMSLDNLDLEDQWVDEVVMLAGDKTQFDLFSDYELHKLHALANDLDYTMDQYEQFAMPVESNISLFTKSHGASGMLDPENVVFYHPLDDYTEHTLSDTWTGDPTFVPGIIGSGNSAISPSTLSFTTPSDAQGLLTNTTPEVIELDSTHVLVLRGKSTGSGVFAKVGTISGTSIDYGDEVKFMDIAGAIRGFTAAALSPTKFVATCHSHLISEGYVWAGSVSGNTITLGSGTQIFGGGRGADSISIVGMSSSGAVLHMNDASMRTLSISGLSITETNDIASPDAVDNRTTSLNKIDDTRFLFTYADAASGSYPTCTVCSLSGASITFGDPIRFPVSAGFPSAFELDIASETFALVGNYSNLHRVWIGTVSGTTMSIGPMNDTTHYGSSAAAYGTALSTNRITIMDIGGNIQVGEVSGTSITFGAESSIPDYVGGIGTPSQNQLLGLSSTSLFISFEGTSGLRHTFGTVDEISELIASTPDEYPSAISVDKIITAFWAKNPTLGDSEVVLQRDYTVTFGSGSISLGENTATWSGAGIAAIMGVMNDNEDHFLVADFTHQSGTTWELKTSLDGAAFVSQGNESGQSLATSNTDPEIEVTSTQVATRYLDEAVMWAGNTSQLDEFSDFELHKLHGLASLLGYTMDQYDQFAGPVEADTDLYIRGPISSSGNADLFMRGYTEASGETDFFIMGANVSTDSIDMFIKGIDTTSGNVDLFTEGHIDSDDGMDLFIEGVELVFDEIINRFTKTADYTPQLIGRFGNGETSVTIEVWEVTDAANVSVTLADNACYPIGNTGRWGWSTEHLPHQYSQVGQFVFRMTSDLAETVVDEFSINSPEEGKWIHPNSFGDYIA